MDADDPDRGKHAEDLVDFEAFGITPERLARPGGVVDGRGPTTEPLVDCGARFGTCRSVCCSMYWIPLTRAEVASGRYHTDPEVPTRLARDENGTCVHHDVAQGRCGIWAERPLVCRLYWCIDAEGVWADFSRGRLSNEAADLVRRLKGERSG